GTERTPMLMVEEGYLLSHDFKVLEQGSRFFLVVHLGVRIIRTVGVAAKPLVGTHASNAPGQLAMALQFVLRKAKRCERFTCALYRQGPQAELTQQAYFDRVIDRGAVVEHGDDFTLAFQYASYLAHREFHLGNVM